MAEQWIPAAQARDLLSTSSNTGLPVEALCRRAEAGLIQTRAKLLAMGEANRSPEAQIPRVFWLTGGSIDLEQNWEAGDFRTWIGDDRWQAFGVTFALSGVLEMLPIERRPVVARQLSVAGNPAWMTARAARAFAFKAGVSPKQTGTAILGQARLGFVAGRSVLAQRFDPPKGFSVSWTKGFTWKGGPTWEEREWDIPVSIWQGFTDPKSSGQDWELGHFEGAGPGPKGRCLMSLESVYFLAESLEVLLPASARAQEVAPNNQGKGGGQPPRAFWDEMLCDIWALIYQGNFTPKLQKDVEVAMLTWAERKGEKLSEATARPKAKMLFERYKHEAENFLAEE